MKLRKLGDGNGGGKIPAREAMRILMLSPLWKRFDVVGKKQLIIEFCQIHGGSSIGSDSHVSRETN